MNSLSLTIKKLNYYYFAILLNGYLTEVTSQPADYLDSNDKLKNNGFSFLYESEQINLFSCRFFYILVIRINHISKFYLFIYYILRREA